MPFFLFWKNGALENDYFPLRKGRTSSYCVYLDKVQECYYYKMVIEKDTVIKGSSYSKVCFIYEDTLLNRIRFIRAAEGNILFREYPNSKEFVYLPRKDSLFLSYKVEENNCLFSNKIVNLYDSIKTPRGKYDSLINLESYNITKKQQINYYFKKETGLVATKINGKLYSYTLD
jgi:hypothetical protein